MKSDFSYYHNPCNSSISGSESPNLSFQTIQKLMWKSVESLYIEHSINSSCLFHFILFRLERYSISPAWVQISSLITHEWESHHCVLIHYNSKENTQGKEPEKFSPNLVMSCIKQFLYFPLVWPFPLLVVRGTLISGFRICCITQLFFFRLQKHC